MALFTSSCSTNSDQQEGHEHSADTHQHEGEATAEEEHGHPHNEDGSHQQEDFTIEGDSLKVDTTSTTSASTHKHDGQQAHQH